MLNRWSNYNSFYLFAIKLPNSYTNGPEHTIEAIGLDTLRDVHWGKKVMREKINWVTLDEAELTDFLYTTNNATFGFINLRTKNCYEVYLVFLSPIASLKIGLDNF